MIDIENYLGEIKNSLKEYEANIKISQEVENFIIGILIEKLKNIEISYLGHDKPEEFINYKEIIFKNNSIIPDGDFFISLQTSFYDYIGEEHYISNKPAGILRIILSPEEQRKCDLLLNSKTDKELIFLFFKNDKSWCLPIYSLSKCENKYSLISIFPAHKNKIEITNESASLKKREHAFHEYILDLYKKNIYTIFNKNVDLIHCNKNNDLLVPHFYLKKKKKLSAQDWKNINITDNKKLSNLNFYLENSIKL